MRRIIPALCLAIAVFLAIRLAQQSPAGAQRTGDKVAETNGDVNCDGKRNVADAVHLLNWLFLGGPEPCPVACAEQRVSPGGAWMMKYRYPGGTVIHGMAITPLDLSGDRFAVEIKHTQCSASVLSSFPDANKQIDLIGEWVRIGPDTFEGTVISHGIREGDESTGWVDQVIYIEVASGTMRLIDENTLEALSGTASYFLASQDKDLDGLPDAGERPIACASYPGTGKRIPHILPCTPGN